MISDVILGKPSKAASLVFLIFGYILASYVVSPIDLVFEQKVPAIIVAGGVLSAALFYIKPVDLLIKTILGILFIRGTKSVERDIRTLFHVYRSELLKEKFLWHHPE